MSVFVLTDLKVFTDPTAPPIKKLLMEQYQFVVEAMLMQISHQVTVPPQAKIASSACCGVLWLACRALEWMKANGH